MRQKTSFLSVEEDNQALVPRPPSAVAKTELGVKRILSDMVAEGAVDPPRRPRLLG